MLMRSPEPPPGGSVLAFIASCGGHHAFRSALDVCDHRLLHSCSSSVRRVAVAGRAINFAWHDARDATNGTWGAKNDPAATAVQPDLAACVARLKRAGPEPDRRPAACRYPAVVTAEYSAARAGTELTRNSRRIVPAPNAEGCFEGRPGSARKAVAAPQSVRSLYAALGQVNEDKQTRVGRGLSCH